MGRRKIVLSPRYLTDAHALRVVGGSPASRALGAAVRALAGAASLPLEGDVYTFLSGDGGLQVLAHSRRAPRCNLWVWYWATDQDLTLVGLTNVPPVARWSCGGRMNAPMLEITFRRGRRLAAHVHLSSARRKAGTTRQLAPSLLGDFDKRGALLGLEILAFDKATIARINQVLLSCGCPALPAKELAPLRARESAPGAR